VIPSAIGPNNEAKQFSEQIQHEVGLKMAKMEIINFKRPKKRQ